MSLDEGNFPHGGIEIGVGLDDSGLEADLAKVEARLDRFAREQRLDVPVGLAAGAAGPSSRAPAPSSARAPAPIVPAAGHTDAMLSKLAAGIQAEVRKAVRELARGLDGAIDQLRKVARSSRVSANALRGTELAQHDVQVADRADFHASHSRRLLARAAGRKSKLQYPDGHVANLPADVRAAAGGIEFTGARKLVPKGGSASPAAAIATAGHAGATLERAGAELRRAAADLSRTARAARLPAGVPPVPLVLHPDAIHSSLEHGRLPSGFHDPTRTDFVPGSARQGPYYRRPRATAPPPDALAGGIAPDATTGARTSKRSRRGSVDLRAVSDAVKGLAEAARRTEAALAGVGHAGALGFNRVMAAGRAVERQVGRVAIATRGVRAVLGGLASVAVAPFALAARAVGIWDNRVGAGTNSLRVLGRVGGGLKVALVAPFHAARAAAGGLASSLTGLVGLVAKVGAGLVVGMAVRGVKASMELNQSISRVKTSFGDASGGVIEFANQMRDKFGVARKDLLEAQSLFGDTLTNMGIDKGKAAEMSNELAARAADIASHYSIPIGDATKKLNSGLTGQYRGLKEIGTVIDPKKVRGDAKGGVVGDGEAAETATAADALARYKAVMDGTINSHGNLAQTSNNTSNLLREVQGRIEDAAAAIGSRLEPAFGQVLLLLNEVWAGGNKVSDGIRTGIAAVGDAVVGAIRFLRQMWQEWDAGVELVGALGMQLAQNIGAVISWIGDSFSTFFTWFTTNWRTIFTDAFELVTKGVANLVKNLQDLGKAFMTWVKDPMNNPFEYKATSLMDGVKLKTPKLEMPELKLPNSYADKIGELIAKITGTKLEREPTKDAARRAERPDDGADAGKEKKKRKEKDHAGALLGAKEFLDALQRSAMEKDKHAEQTAKHAGAIDKKMGRLVALAERPRATVLA